MPKVTIELRTYPRIVRNETHTIELDGHSDMSLRQEFGIIKSDPVRFTNPRTLTSLYEEVELVTEVVSVLKSE